MSQFQERLKSYKPLPQGAWFRVRSIDEMQQFFRSRLPLMQEAARKCGYALGVHGSERRDFDLSAAPWVDNPLDLDLLADAIMSAACGMKMGTYQWESKPLGRKAACFPICWPEWDGTKGVKSLGHVDLSVMPKGAE